MILTHVNVDMDATFSTIVYCLTQKVPLDDQNIRFVPANYKEIKDYDIPIDLEYDKHTEPSYLMKFKEYLPAEFLNAVNNVDQGKIDSTGWSLCFRALKMSQIQDMDMLKFWEPVVKGLFRIQSERFSAEASFLTVPTVMIGKYKFLKCDNIKWNHNFKHIAIREGFAGKVYLENFNLGIQRFVYNEPDLRKLPGINEDGWYVDNRSFLICRGSHKAEAKDFSKKFPTLDSFILWLQEKFTDYKL